jgi:hypothetical protein
MVNELSVPAQQENVFEILDLADEEQIIAEISGRVTDKYVYSFKQAGQDVTGLSYAGTNWACREFAKQGEVIRVIHKDSIVDPINPEYIVITITAQRFAVNLETNRETPLDSTFGIKRQWTKMKKRRYDAQGNVVGEEIVEDPHFWEKGTSKAIRNAKQALIPTDMVKKLIQEALKTKNSSSVRPGDQRAQRQTQATKSQQAQSQGPEEPKPASTPQTPPAQTAKPAQAPQATPAQTAKPEEPKAPPTQAAPAAAPARTPITPDQAIVKGSKDALVQKFEVVLKKAMGTADPLLARQYLKAISGTDRITDFSEEDLTKYGRVLQGIGKGLYKLADDKSHVTETATGKVIWGSVPAAAPAAPPPAEEPKKGGEENYF